MKQTHSPTYSHAWSWSPLQGRPIPNLCCRNASFFSTLLCPCVRQVQEKVLPGWMWRSAVVVYVCVHVYVYVFAKYKDHLCPGGPGIVLLYYVLAVLLYLYTCSASLLYMCMCIYTYSGGLHVYMHM